MTAKNVAIEIVTGDAYVRRLAGEGALAPEVECARTSAAWVMNKSCQIERVAANTPRAAYLSQGQGSGGVGDYHGWLVEPGRTNQLVYANPNSITPTGWSSFNLGGAAVVTLVNAFGLNAIRFNVTATGRRAITDNVSLTAIRTYCISAYVNLDTFTGNPAQQLLWASAFSGATITGAATVANADEDGRIWFYLTTGFDTSGTIWVGPGAVSNATPGVYEITGWQCEEVPDTGCLPSSLIVTGATTATRAAEKLVIDGDEYAGMAFIGGDYSPLVVQGENRLSPSITSTIWSASDGTSNNQSRLRAAANTYSAQVVNGGVVQRDSGLVVAAAGDRVTVANGGVGQLLYVDNGLEGFTFGGTLPTTTDRLEIGATPDGEAHFVIRDLFFCKTLGAYSNSTDASVSAGFANNGTFSRTTKISLFPVADDQHEPRLLEAPEYRVEGGSWIWGTRTRTQVGDATVANPDGALNYILRDVSRGTVSTIKVGDRSAAYADYQDVAKVEVDAVSESEGGDIVISFASPDIRLCEFINQRIYAAAPNTNIVGDPRPITFGRCRQVGAIEFDPTGPTYHVHDQIFDGTSFAISEVQSNGNPASALDWSVDDFGFTMSVTPSGRVTAYISEGVYGNTTNEVIEGILGDAGAYSRGRFIDFDATELQAITDAFSNPTAGMFIDRPVTVKDALHWFLDPFLAMVYVDATGKLRFARIQDPAGGSPVLTIAKENVDAGTWPAREDDSMPGLTGRFAGRKNWAPIPRESVAGALSLSAQADASAEYRLHSIIPRTEFSRFYGWAAESEALETGLDEQTALDAVSDNVRATCLPAVAGKRQFYRLRASFDEIPLVSLGDVVTVEWPDINPLVSTDTDQLMVAGFRSRFGSNQMEFTLWA